MQDQGGRKLIPVRKAPAPVAKKPKSDGRRARKRTLILLAALAVTASVWFGLWRWMSPDPEFWLEQARIMLRDISAGSGSNVQKRATLAREYCENYLRENGKDAQAGRALLCAAWRVSGQWEEAARLEPGIVASQLHTDDLMIVGPIFLRTGNFELAEDCANEAVSREGVLSAALRLRIELRLAQRDIDAAFGDARRLADVTPNDPYPWLVMADFYDHQGYRDQGSHVYAKLAQLIPTKREHYLCRAADRLIESGDAPGARAMLAGLRQGQSPQYQLSYSRLLLLENKTDEALQMLEKLLASDPENRGALLTKGRTLLTQSKFRESQRALLRLLKLDPAAWEAHYLLAQVYTQLGDEQTAKRHAELHQAIFAKNVEFFQLQLRVHQNPADVEARAELAKLFESVGLPPQSLSP